MPILNGDSMNHSVEALDHTLALEVLQEYPDKDGVDVRTLLDSKTRGGLTYNDFLVLPGYIGSNYSVATCVIFSQIMQAFQRQT